MAVVTFDGVRGQYRANFMQAMQVFAASIKILFVTELSTHINSVSQEFGSRSKLGAGYSDSQRMTSARQSAIPDANVSPRLAVPTIPDRFKHRHCRSLQC